jgi:hypothetical protein
LRAIARVNAAASYLCTAYQRHERTGELGCGLCMPGHKYVIGATRSGKTNFLLSEAEGPFAFIDKHGEAARQLADAMPCVYWRPADLSHPIGLNPLSNVKPDERWKVTADIVSVFSDIWKLGPETPRLLYLLRGALRLLLDTPGTTLLDIRRTVFDATYRAGLLRKCSDREVRQTWREFDGKDARQQATEVGSLLNKVAALADPLPLRYVLGQPNSTISLSKILERGTPLVLDLSDLGDEPAAILGAIVINGIKQGADTFTAPQPYRLFIDEFQNFGTSIISTILSESAKRGLYLTLAHQFISQLDEEIRDAVLGNCSTIVSFRVGAEDAPIIGNAIDWNPQNLQDLGLGQARMRTLVNGRPSSALLLETTKMELPTGHLAANIRNTRANFARMRKDVEHALRAPQRRASNRKRW